MNILWVTSEAVPFAKTGGLADVSGALPEALAARGHKVTVFMPYYPQQMGKLNLQFDRTYDMFGVPLFGSTQWCGLHVYRKSENLSFYFLEYNKFYDRPRLYDWVGQEYGDNAERFILLSRAAMEAAIHFRLDPDIIHANDWHSALCCVYLRSAIYSGIHNFRNTKSVLTIHNIGYQGIFPKDKLYATGLGWEYFNYTCLEFHDRLNFLKAGIMTADMVNTVSPTYAKEILSPEFSFSMDPALQYRNNQGRLRGIINGIDTNEWDPLNDPLLPANFSPGKLDGKKICKETIQKHFGLPVRDDVPMFASISRLAWQKGLDVLASAMDTLLQQDDFQFVLFGSGDPALENRYHWLQEHYPQKFAFFAGYAPDNLTHTLEAGADFFVMPSRYEPCGLNQMYSMRFGTLPIVRETGGLADTVTPPGHAVPTGFRFRDLYPEALVDTIRWAADIRKNDPGLFSTMRTNAMTADFSWNRTATDYERLYEDAHK